MPRRSTPCTTIHGSAGLAAFTLLAAGALLMAWQFAADPGSRRWTVYSAAVGALVVVCFIASTASIIDARGTWPNVPTGFLQRIAIIGGWTWIAMLALHVIREDDSKNRSRG